MIVLIPTGTHGYSSFYRPEIALHLSVRYWYTTTVKCWYISIEGSDISLTLVRTKTKIPSGTLYRIASK